jgi:hypothetical protein
MAQELRSQTRARPAFSPWSPLPSLAFIRPLRKLFWGVAAQFFSAKSIQHECNLNFLLI